VFSFFECPMLRVGICRQGARHERFVGANVVWRALLPGGAIMGRAKLGPASCEMPLLVISRPNEWGKGAPAEVSQSEVRLDPSLPTLHACVPLACYKPVATLRPLTASLVEGSPGS
jgi:hypothetical protein